MSYREGQAQLHRLLRAALIRGLPLDFDLGLINGRLRSPIANSLIARDILSGRSLTLFCTQMVTQVMMAYRSC